jgi:hypothetical protein
MLACFFCSLLINLPLGINSQWISTIDNKIADNISHLKQQSDNNSSPAFDYTFCWRMGDNSGQEARADGNGKGSEDNDNKGNKKSKGDKGEGN